MIHPIYRVRSFEIVADYTLRVRSDDNTEQTIDFRPILAGELYGRFETWRYSIRFASIRRRKR
jgi:hypothetical protein